MPSQPYSFGVYTVRKGKEREFIDLWNKFANWSLSQYNAAGPFVRLVQDQDNPQKFFSFAEWNDYKDIQDWRNKLEFNDYLNKFRDVCDHIERFGCKVVSEIPVSQKTREEVRTRGK